MKSHHLPLPNSAISYVVLGKALRVLPETKLLEPVNEPFANVPISTRVNEMAPELTGHGGLGRS